MKVQIEVDLKKLKDGAHYEIRLRKDGIVLIEVPKGKLNSVIVSDGK